jgi:hypothetical protein
MLIGEQDGARATNTVFAVPGRSSIANEQNAFQRELKSPADIKRLKKVLNLGKIVRLAICVAYGDREVQNVMHHARLKDVLEKLVVIDGPTCLYLKNPSLTGGVSVSVETLQYLAFAPKKYGNNYLAFARLPSLDSECKLFQAWAESCHDGVAMLTCLCARVDRISRFFEKCDDMKAEFRRR